MIRASLEFRSVLSNAASIEDLKGYLADGHLEADHRPSYLEALKTQESRILKIKEYGGSCNNAHAYLYLKVSSTKLEMTRAHIQFNVQNGTFLIKAVSLESRESEKEMDDEVTYKDANI